MLLRFTLLIALFCGFSLQIIGQNACPDVRYINEIFVSQVTQEPELYGSAPTNLGVMQDLSFDFYEPVGDTLSKRPLIIMAFGGSFLVGDKRQAELVDYCEAMTRRGFCVASIDYRLGFNLFSTNSAVRAVYRGLQDFKAAVRFFRVNAASYGIDETRIYGGGNSAGGISAIHAAYAVETDRVNQPDSLLQATFNFPDQGCMDCSGNTLVANSHPDAVVNLWGGIGKTYWINSGESPIISFHGLDDTTVSPNAASPFGYPIFPILYGSIPIHARANSQGIINELNTYTGQGHEMWADPVLALEFQVKSANFLNDLMKPAAPTIGGNLSACPNEVTSYCIAGTSPDSKFCWSVTGGVVVADNNDCITVQWTTPGSIGTITATERNCVDASGDPVTLNVNISQGVTANFSYSYTGATTNFTNLSTGGSTYLWDFGDGTTSSLANPSHTYTSNGTYTAELIVISVDGCVDSFVTTVTQSCQPTLDLNVAATPSGLYEALNWVHSNQPLVGGSNVTFQAGDHVEMYPNFEVNLGDEFLARIVGCSN